MKQLKLQLLILSTALVTFFQVTAQSNPGKLSLKKGQKIQLNNTMKSVTSFEMMGQAMEMTSDAYLENQVEVKDKKTSSYLVGSKFTKMAINGSAMGQTFTYDSDKKEDENSEIGKRMNGFLNKENDLEISEDGKAIDNPADSANKNEAAEAISSLAGGVDFTKAAAEAFLVLPAGAKNGFSWSDSVIAEGIKTYRDYSIKEINNKIATVSLTGNQTTNKTVQQMGMDVQVNLVAKISGEFKVDTATGIVLERNVVSEGNGTADAAGQSIPLTTKLTANTTVKTL